MCPRNVAVSWNTKKLQIQDHKLSNKQFFSPGKAKQASKITKFKYYQSHYTQYCVIAKALHIIFSAKKALSKPAT